MPAGRPRSCHAGPGQAGAACPEDGSGAGAKRHGAGRTGGASPLGEAGLSAPDARPRPRQSRGKAPAPGRRTHWAARELMRWQQGGRGPATRGGVRMRTVRDVRLSVAQRAYVARDPRRPALFRRRRAGWFRASRSRQRGGGDRGAASGAAGHAVLRAPQPWFRAATWQGRGGRRCAGPGIARSRGGIGAERRTKSAPTAGKLPPEMRLLTLP